MFKQPWLGRKWLEILFIIAPPFLCLLFIMLFPQFFGNNSEMSTASWVILVLLVDVAHVYSTLFRTYFDPKALSEQRSLLWAIPLICFVLGVVLYSLSPAIFWTILAYTAVWHFIRQQYGFVRVYSRNDPAPKSFQRIDTVAIYAATLYPILFWHFKADRTFTWFVKGDFLIEPWPAVLPFLFGAYALILIAWLIKEILFIRRFKTLNLPRFLVIVGTAFSWYFGIVHFNGDMAFTLLNVVSHGIPYMALIWIYGERNYSKGSKGTRFLKFVFTSWGLMVFVGLMVLFAFVEEGVWDITVWRDHPSVFGNWSGFEASPTLLALLVPFLILPQITHYVLDGFIWKGRQQDMKGILRH